MIIGVIGGSLCTNEEAELAEEVGRELARRGAAVVCGGLGGIMEAVCRGAKSAGGTTIGILPGDERESANPYVDIPIVTGMGYARNVIVVKTAEAIIAIHGSYGTLSEIAYALSNGIPIVGISTWTLTQNGEPDSTIVLADTAAEAVQKAIEMAETKTGERRW